jgi:hypothetical protein
LQRARGEGKERTFLENFVGFWGRASSPPALRFLLAVVERVTRLLLGRSAGSALVAAGGGLVERAALVVALPPRGLPGPAIT